MKILTIKSTMLVDFYYCNRVGLSCCLRGWGWWIY